MSDDIVERLGSILDSEMSPTERAVIHAAQAEVERLRQTVRDRYGWNEHLVAEVSHLLLAVPRPFRMIVHRRAERIASQEARRER